MARKAVSIKEAADLCGFKRETLSRKLAKKSPLILAEAFKIQQVLFPELGVEYLFDLSAKEERAELE